MESKMKFLGLFNGLDFEKLTEGDVHDLFIKEEILIANNYPNNIIARGEKYTGDDFSRFALNDDLFKEIIFVYENCFLGINLQVLDLIRKKISLELTKKDKIKKLEKEYSKLSKQLFKNELYLEASCFEIKVEDLLKIKIEEEEELTTIKNHLFSDNVHSYSFGSPDIKIYEEILSIEYIQFQLKSLLKELEKDKNTRVSYFSRSIFKHPNAGEILFKVLNEENVIDDNDNPKKGFNNRAYNFFKIKDSLKNKIFRKNVKLKDYCVYLENTFNITIKNHDKLGALDFNAEIIGKYVETLLKEHEK